jgi:protein-tyrosine phosphatase
LLSSAGDLSPVIKEALWSWRDPLPFFAELGRMLWSFVSTVFKSGARKLASRKLQSYVGIYSRLEPQARSRYVEFRMKDAFGMTSRNGHSAGPTAQSARSVLFVCYGNLMRSPMAEAMLRHGLLELGVSGVSVKSAGVHAVRGREAHTWAQAVSRELGMPLDAHRAQPTTPDLIASSDLIFAMDYENLAELETKYPEARGRISLLSCYADGPLRNREIPDPYFGDIETTRRCYAVLGECIEKLAQELSLSHNGKEAPLAR